MGQSHCMGIDSIMDTCSTSCDATLGSPKQANCLNAAGNSSFQSRVSYSSQAILHSFPSMLFFVLVANVKMAGTNCSSGECSIAVGFQVKTTVSPDVLKTVFDTVP